MKNKPTSSRSLMLLGLGLGVATTSLSFAAGIGVGPVGTPNGNLGVGGGAGGALGSGIGGAAGGIGGGVGGGIGRGHAGAGGAAGGAFGGDVFPDARADAFESTGMRRERLARETTGRTEAQAKGLAVARAHAASSALDRGLSDDWIRGAGVSAREHLATDIDRRIEASHDAMASMKSHAGMLEGSARADFKAATKDVAAREKALKASVKSARRASAEAWVDRRAEVAANYEAYTRSVARAEAVMAAGLDPAPAAGAAVSAPSTRTEAAAAGSADARSRATSAGVTGAARANPPATSASVRGNAKGDR